MRYNCQLLSSTHFSPNLTAYSHFLLGGKIDSNQNEIHAWFEPEKFSTQYMHFSVISHCATVRCSNYAPLLYLICLHTRLHSVSYLSNCCVLNSFQRVISVEFFLISAGRHKFELTTFTNVVRCSVCTKLLW